MSQERLSRVKKLVEVRARALDEVRLAHARAGMEVGHATTAHAAALSRWYAQITKVSETDWPTIAEFTEARAHIDALHHRVEQASRLLERTRAEQERLRQAVLRASRELKKVEIW